MTVKPKTDKFLSTLPARGATERYDETGHPYLVFLSTLPARGATEIYCQGTAEDDISIHAPREGSDDRQVFFIVRERDISIHAPREGSDVDRHRPRPGLIISIHAPREGSDPLCAAHCTQSFPFLSTLPARGATICCCTA